MATKSRAGRPGAINLNARTSVARVFHALGGIDNMLKWAKINETDFYKHIYPKLIVTRIKNTLSGDKENPIAHAHELTRETLERIAAGGS